MFDAFPNAVVREEVLLLKERALKAYERAKEAFEKGDYDWSIFLLEQSVQLLVKHFLAMSIGYFPKTHRLIELLEEAGQVEPRLLSFLKENRDALRLLEDAYINSRYMPARYAREDLEGKFEIFERLLRVVEEHGRA